MTNTSTSPRGIPPAAPLRHRWKILAAGVAANAAFSVAFSGIPTTAVVMRADYALDNATLGLVLGLMGLGIALSELPWGMLTDRWGDRPVLLTGLVGTAIALAAMAVFAAPTPHGVPGLGWLGSGLVVVGLLGGSVNGASGRAVMSWFGDGERGLAMSIRQTAVPMGGAIGALALPMIAHRFGFAVVYVVLSLLCVAAAALSWTWVHEPPPSREESQAASHSVAGIVVGKSASPLGDARIWRIVAGIGVLCAPQFAVISFGTVFLHDVGHLGLTSLTAAMVFVQGGAMVMRVWSGRWTDRRRNRPSYLRACSGLSVLLFGALAAAALVAQGRTGMPLSLMVLLTILLAVSGVCVSAWHGVAYAELATLAGAARSGTALGMANTFVFGVCFLTPLAIPHLVALDGWPLVWIVVSACALAAMPLLAPAKVARA